VSGLAVRLECAGHATCASGETDANGFRHSSTPRTRCGPMTREVVVASDRRVLCRTAIAVVCQHGNQRGSETIALAPVLGSDRAKLAIDLPPSGAPLAFRRP
jgi:hypothetical protein